MKAVDVLAVTVDTVTGSPVLLLGERDDPHRVLPIFVGHPEALAIALALDSRTRPPPRPLTHDLLVAFLDCLDARVQHVEVTGVHGGTFHAALAVRSRRGALSVDSRPSDAIALALRVDAPVYASDAVLDEAARTLVTDVVAAGGDEHAADGEAVDEEVALFRAFLDGADPSGFDTGGGPDEPPGRAGA